ncbi:endo alpha-1,4 polygalactosaminidase [Microvirga zambiensis]|uniref:endo alpha-1,4 polygalactosaminidase n=1 Tax=Microvirga zambiensis TaxID=1402137 RepID=UPI00191D471D|nr:endo alpha-1,4 polygalactosaminidase [Microvirga zambiensis]
MITTRIRASDMDKPLLNRRVVGISLAVLVAAALRGNGDRSLAGTGHAGKLYRQHKSLMVYYGDRYDTIPDDDSLLIIEDREAAEPFVRRRIESTILGYVSIAEVHSGRPYYSRLRSKGALGAPNPAWPDAYFVDVRSDAWRSLLLNEIIPAILKNGYQGIFLDTLDSAETLERQDPVKFKGMIAAAADLVRAIRSAFPSIIIMVNRGYAILPLIPGEFDYLLGESVRSTFNAKTGTYYRRTEQDIEWQRARMLEARDRDPSLQLFSLDYWDPKDRAGLAKLYAEARADGFVPYVATPDLMKIVPEPLPSGKSP